MKRPQKRRRLSVSSTATSATTDSTRHGTVSALSSDGTANAALPNALMITMQPTDACISCSRALAGAATKPGALVVCPRCHATSCAICARTCTAIPPSEPPTPQLTFSPSPPGTPLYAFEGHHHHHLPLPLPPSLSLAARAHEPVQVPEPRLVRTTLDVNADDGYAGTGVQTTTRTRVRAARAGTDAGAQAGNASGTLRASTVRKKRHSDSDENTHCRVDTDSSSGTDLSGAGAHSKDACNSFLPGCGRTMCRNCCFENMQSGTTTCYDCYGISIPTSTDQAGDVHRYDFSPASYPSTPSPF